MIKKHSVISMLLLTGFILSAMVVYADWVAPLQQAPLCETDFSSPNYDPACESPLNVGGQGQTKEGGIALGTSLSEGDTGLAVYNGTTKTKGGLQIEVRASDPNTSSWGSQEAGRIWIIYP